MLFVEDDPAGREMGVYNLQHAGYVVEAVSNGEEALKCFSPERHTVVVTDLRLPGKSGIEVLKAIRRRAPHHPVLIITAFGAVDSAVEAMKEGAQDFISKPFSRDHLLLRIERAIANAGLREEVHTLRAQAHSVERPFVCASKHLRAVLDVVDRVAASESTVLISGETGTGKELIARRVHARSPRSKRRFVVVNCAAIAPELIESELFGHEKGTFTGAVRARLGRFRQAHGGTILLDEIGELPLAVQGRLLRVLQEGTVDVVGADKPAQVDVRVVAATNRDLLALTATGSFRADLYYRLNVVEITLPPLRERPEEIEPLVRHFVRELAPDRELAIPKALLVEIRRRPWPGNVRQLRNACERMVTLCHGDILSADDLPRLPKDPPPQDTPSIDQLPPNGFSLVDLEKRVIERVLQLKRGNVSRAAQYLQIPRHVLAYRIVKYGLRRKNS